MSLYLPLPGWPLVSHLGPPPKWPPISWKLLGKGLLAVAAEGGTVMSPAALICELLANEVHIVITSTAVLVKVAIPTAL